MFAKPPRNGNARCWICTGRPAAPVPETVPTSVVGPPKAVGFGFAASATRSTCAGVRNVRSAVTEVPEAFVATSRTWKVAAGTRPTPGAETFTAAAPAASAVGAVCAP